MNTTSSSKIQTVDALLAVSDFSTQPLTDVLIQTDKVFKFIEPVLERIDGAKHTPEGAKAQQGLDHIMTLVGVGKNIREIMDTYKSKLTDIIGAMNVSMKEPVHTNLRQVLLDAKPLDGLRYFKVNNRSSALECIEILTEHLKPEFLGYSSSKTGATGNLKFFKTYPKEAKHLLGWINWCTACGIEKPSEILDSVQQNNKPRNMQGRNAALKNFKLLEDIGLPIENITPRNAPHNFYVHW